ncbi:MAG TPA: cytochrome c oxidase assembly protein [Actinomycetota bacterium]|nr:cytochrome c oxidase assembly protein [Actinomycetota bacterium]
MSVLDWHPHPEVWALLAASAGGYVLAQRRWGAATRSQKTLFGLGLLTLLVASEWPVHELAERALYSVHMVQHLLISLIAPPLLMRGVPAPVWRGLLGAGARLRVVRTLSKPLLALVIFNAVIVLTHWPALVDASLRSEPIHFGVHLLLFSSAMLMWVPVLSPILELPALSYPGRMFYLFLQSLVPTVPASFLTFGDSVLYRFYAAAPRVTSLSALDDQRLAGLIMKLAGGFVLWAVIALLFMKWYSAERSSDWDALAWRDVDRQMRTGLSRG